MKINIVALTYTCLFFILISCASTRPIATGATPRSQVSQGFAEVHLSDKKSERESPGGTKVISSAFLTLLVESTDSANTAIQKLTSKYEGYIVETSNATMVVRVKSAHLEEAISEISGFGKLQSKNLKGIDVTSEYLDYEIRLENAIKTRNRYLELLQVAKEVDDILKIERELERLNETIDLLKGQINEIDELTNFATITIYLKSRKKPGVIGYVGIGLYKSAKWLFVRN